ncbi:MAG: hypothetical protein BWY52_02457 [Chloroflexi bacterium ADurb.Bin325]|nr:MAG: hypothetical protein BWY52_02457 [Chloroflexi bacterium ADurb.Bin325]
MGLGDDDDRRLGQLGGHQRRRAARQREAVHLPLQRDDHRQDTREVEPAGQEDAPQLVVERLRHQVQEERLLPLRADGRLGDPQHGPALLRVAGDAPVQIGLRGPRGERGRGLRLVREVLALIDEVGIRAFELQFGQRLVQRRGELLDRAHRLRRAPGAEGLALPAHADVQRAAQPDDAELVAARARDLATHRRHRLRLARGRARLRFRSRRFAFLEEIGHETALLRGDEAAGFGRDEVAGLAHGWGIQFAPLRSKVRATVPTA